MLYYTIILLFCLMVGVAFFAMFELIFGFKDKDEDMIYNVTVETDDGKIHTDVNLKLINDKIFIKMFSFEDGKFKTSYLNKNAITRIIYD